MIRLAPTSTPEPSTVAIVSLDDRRTPQSLPSNDHPQPAA